MKRMYLLLNRRNILPCLGILLVFSLSIPAFLYFLFALAGDSTEGIFRTQVPLYFVIGLGILLLYSRYIPLYLEYDDEKIIAHYFFNTTATVWKTKTIYTGKLYLGRAGFQLLYSNEPFAVSPPPLADNSEPSSLSTTKLNRRTQITLPIELKEAIALFPREMCLAAEKADWASLTAHHRDKPAEHSLNRKLRLVPGYWKELTLLTFFFLYVAGVTLLVGLTKAPFAMFVVYLICYLSFPWIMLMVFTRNVAKSFRYCATVFLGEHTVETHFLGRKLCVVDLNETVYYAVFRGRENDAVNTPYIVVSNQWFNYYTVNRPNHSYLSEYPMDTQVAFPYNAETAPLCDFDNWHCVGGFGELNMKRSPKTNN